MVKLPIFMSYYSRSTEEEEMLVNVKEIMVYGELCSSAICASSCEKVCPRNFSQRKCNRCRLYSDKAFGLDTMF